MYVITGASGNTGGLAARALLSKGKKVRAMGRNTARLQSLAAAGAEPFVGDLTDTAALTKAFRGAEAVYIMIPPNPASPDYRAEQDQVSDSAVRALQESGVKYVVNLSSFGADKEDKTGPIAGLHQMERKLNEIPSLNVLHLRAGYFMENTLGQIGAIQAMGTAVGPLRPDLKIPMIASRDIGAAAAEALLSLNFSGQQTRELLGQRDITMTEATAIIGKAIGKSDLAYHQLPDEQFRMALVGMGFSLNVANLILEMSAALNSGHAAALEKRSAKNTTPTSYETFVAEEIAPRLQTLLG